MKYVWAFVIFIGLILIGIVSIIGELLEFAFGVALTGIRNPSSPWFMDLYKSEKLV